jgi:hypothetical protein
MKLRWGMVGVLLVAAYPAGALGDHVAAIGGAGNDTCAAWVQDRSAGSESARQASQRRLEWVSGFFSAINVFDEPSGSLHGGIDDRDGMVGWIDNYCRAHPNDPVWLAAADLVLDLRNKKRSSN